MDLAGVLVGGMFEVGGVAVDDDGALGLPLPLPLVEGADADGDLHVLLPHPASPTCALAGCVVPCWGPVALGDGAGRGGGGGGMGGQLLSAFLGPHASAERHAPALLAARWVWRNGVGKWRVVVIAAGAGRAPNEDG